MAHKNPPDRGEVLILTAALAVAGTLFLFDKLGAFMQTGNMLAHALLHSSPMLVVVVGVSLVLADTVTADTDQHSSTSRYE